jgi:hypothetical protein
MVEKSQSSHVRPRHVVTGVPLRAEQAVVLIEGQVGVIHKGLHGACTRRQVTEQPALAPCSAHTAREVVGETCRHGRLSLAHSWYRAREDSTILLEARLRVVQWALSSE